MNITSLHILKNNQPEKIGPISLPARIGIDYNTDLQKILIRIKKNINENLIPVLISEEVNYINDSTWFDRIRAVFETIKRDYETPQFLRVIESVASKFVGAIDGSVTKNFGLDIYGNDENLKTILSISIHDNTRLIKSIAEQYLTNVETIVTNNTRAGLRSSTMIKQLSEQFGVSQKRARFIARDQTAKVNSSIAKERMISTGFEFFQWRTSRDIRVRDRHNVLANTVTKYGLGVYRFDELPLSDSGKPIFPGQDYQCRCTMRPVSNREVEAFMKSA